MATPQQRQQQPPQLQSQGSNTTIVDAPTLEYSMSVLTQERQRIDYALGRLQEQLASLRNQQPQEVGMTKNAKGQYIDAQGNLVHWTQTPEGRIKASLNAQKRQQQARAAQKKQPVKAQAKAAGK